MNKSKVKLNILGMHCTACSINIDGELEDTEGIFSSNTSYAKQQTEVEFDSAKISSEKIIAIIKSIGYDAEINASSLRGTK